MSEWPKPQIQNVVKAVKNNCEMFNCDVETCWNKYIHESIIKHYTIEEIKEYINNN